MGSGIGNETSSFCAYTSFVRNMKLYKCSLVVAFLIEVAKGQWGPSVVDTDTGKVGTVTPYFNTRPVFTAISSSSIIYVSTRYRESSRTQLG